MQNVRNDKQLRARRPVLSAPRPRTLDPGNAGSSEGGGRSSSPVGLGDEWIEQGPTGEGEEVLTQLAHVADERDPVDVKLDLLLIAWHEFRMNYRFGRGHQAASVTREYKAPGHFDWSNGAADAKADDIVDRQVDQCIQRIPNEPQPWRLALEFEAKNLATMASVWVSPRLPADVEARQVLILEARNMLMRELKTDGVMT